MSGKPIPIELRFWPKVDKNGPMWEDGTRCWLWTGAVHNRLPYGMFGINRRPVYAHRVAYELVVGPIPEGLTLDHLCRRPQCVSPLHLEPVTIGENIRRAWSSDGMHCRNGHPYPPGEAIRLHGGRRCVTCAKESKKRENAKKKVALGRPRSWEKGNA